MKYRDLQIQTQREFPNNARTQGFGWLVRAGYLTREGELLPLGQQAVQRLIELSRRGDLLSSLSIPQLSNKTETWFPIASGNVEVIHCPACGFAEQAELAQFRKNPLPSEEPKPVEKVLTPDCNTIDSLAVFLNLPKEKTAKALMYTRLSDGQFVFAAVRGDMNLSEAKLRRVIGEFRLATVEEITHVGAAPGYASPINLRNALILVDDLIPHSVNLAAGANEAGYHLLNTNYGRDYSAATVADLAQAKTGDLCPNCAGTLAISPAIPLRSGSSFNHENILLALAESHHDEKGLAFPKAAAPFDVYLMHIAGKELNTLERAAGIYDQLQAAGLQVLFDDRDERAGVKFNDADLIGCPLRITVGEKNLKNGQVEVKVRREGENHLADISNLADMVKI